MDDVGELPVYELGSPGQQRDRLVARVLDGRKTMTSGLLVHLEMDGERLPEPGDRARLVDSTGERGVVEIVDVRLVTLAEVDATVAEGEGEDFAGVADWRTAHERFWSRWDDDVAEHLGRPGWRVGDDDVVVVEVIRLVTRSS